MVGKINVVSMHLLVSVLLGFYPAASLVCNATIATTGQLLTLHPLPIGLKHNRHKFSAKGNRTTEKASFTSNTLRREEGPGLIAATI